MTEPLDHKHNNNYDLVTVYESVQNEFESVVVRWCPLCGAVVVDMDFDGRTKPGDVMPMRFPKSVGGKG